MNTPELRPIDARTMKPGDPVVHSDGSPGKFIAYVSEASEPNRALFFLDGRNSVYSYTFDGRIAGGESPRIFLPPDPDPVDPSPGNVDKLRKSQVGEGWRIPAHDEKPDRRAKRWSCLNERWVDVSEPGRPYRHVTTYLVPVAPIKTVPLEMKDFVGKPWPLVKGASGTIRAILFVESTELRIAGIGHAVSWHDLRELYTTSWDHGLTWVEAEKEEQA